jgi:hypothetical protein
METCQFDLIMTEAMETGRFDAIWALGHGDLPV